MPVAEFTSIVMLAPLLVTLLAAWLLHERVSRAALGAGGGGLVGALIVIRPGGGLFGWAVLLPLAGGLHLCRLPGADRAHERAREPLHHALLDRRWSACCWSRRCCCSAAPTCWPRPRAASAAQWALLLLMAALGTGGHLLLILALGMAPTATLMPFIYAQIAVAAGLGWLVFGQLPDAVAWLGMAVIAACGAAGAWLNACASAAPHRAGCRAAVG